MPSQANSKYGAFQRMGLEEPLVKAIFACNYRLPTPIQRKVIPLIQGGRSVAALARTGSGKTAAFLIPILNSLSREDAVDFQTSVGFDSVRAIVISPSREVARQTWQVAKALGKHLDIDMDLMTGGESIKIHFDNYSRQRNLPILLMATLGRLVHTLAEMDVAFIARVRYLVLDEADRLFEEKGFCDQLKELINRLPTTRQTVLLSATMPSLITEFLRSGLIHQPVLCYLDKDLRLNPNLNVVHLYCTHEERLQSLCSLMTSVDLGQCCIFVATHYDADLIVEVLRRVCHLNPLAIYGNNRMDDLERNQAMNRFKKKKANVLVATDVAARGVDVPALDTVVNYNFPRAHKLFIHRAGRTARAGKDGTVISLVSCEEMPYLLDLQEILNRELKLDGTDEDNFVLGRPPAADALLRESLHVAVGELDAQHTACQNAWKAYVRNCKPPTKSSVEKWKLQKRSTVCELKLHPMFGKETHAESEKQKFLNGISQWRCRRSIFEINASVHRSEPKQKKTSESNSAKLQDPEYFIPYNSKQDDAFKLDNVARDAMACSFDLYKDDDNGKGRQYSQINKFIQGRKLVWDRQTKKFVSSQKIADNLSKQSGWMKGTERSKYKEWLKSKNQRASGVKPVEEIVNTLEKKRKLKNFEAERRKIKLARKKAKQ